MSDNNFTLDAMIIGAQKAGTSSLYDWLSQHLEIDAPLAVKDFPFFIKDEYYSKGTDFYSRFFNRGDEKITLSGSVNQLSDPETAQRLHNFNPQLKLIVMLRNPVERAYSAYLFNCKRGIEDLSFEDALKNEEKRLKNSKNKLLSYDYLNHGHYYALINKYLKLFSIEQFKFILFEDLLTQKERTINETFEFLGVKADFIPSFNKVNETGKVKYKTINKLVFKDNLIKKILRNSAVLNKIFPLEKRILYRRRILHMNTEVHNKSEMNPSTRSLLQNTYKSDILNLGKLINRDLSSWLS